MCWSKVTPSQITINYFTKPPQFLQTIMPICVNGLLFFNVPSLSLVGTKYGHLLPNNLDVWHRERWLTKSLCSGTEPLKSCIVKTVLFPPYAGIVGKTRSTHFHIFWKCENIVPYWSMVMSLIQQVHSLLLDSLHCLLGLPFPGIGNSMNKLAFLILLAAKRTIPLQWLFPTPPLRSIFWRWF